MLLMLLRAVVAAREREDQRVLALQRAQRPWRRRVIGQRKVPPGEMSARIVGLLRRLVGPRPRVLEAVCTIRAAA
jgi:hypothetical protein